MCEGEKGNTWVVFFEKSMRLSIVRTKAAVFPVPD